MQVLCLDLLKAIALFHVHLYSLDFKHSWAFNDFFSLLQFESTFCLTFCT